MSVTTEPIRSKEDLRRLASYYYNRGELRNYTLVILGSNTALRISHLLSLRWDDVYDFESRSFRIHVTVSEKKTKKKKTFRLNKSALKALKIFFKHRTSPYIFSNGRKHDRPINRVTAWRIITKAVAALHIPGKIACHSLRKTLGYQAWKSGRVPLAIITQIYNHSSYEVKKRYLGITQDDLDDAYMAVDLS